MEKSTTLKKFKKIHQLLEKGINFFNLLFFLISLVIWAYLTIINIFTQPFELGLLWAAFNVMYGQLSFKVGCIILILFNGLQSIRNLIFQYYEIREYGQHLSTIGKILKKKPQL